MQIESEKDFEELRNQFLVWRKRFPMFLHDVKHIERAIEKHIKQYSMLLVSYRQTRKESYLSKAQTEIDSINNILKTVEKMELMAMLSQR